MTKKVKIKLAIIVPALLLIGWSSWYGTNRLVTRQLDLISLIAINDIEAVQYVLRWDSSRVNASSRIRFRRPDNWIGMGPVYMTPVQVASGLGHTEMCSLLLDSGADVHSHDGDGWTPMLLAFRAGHRETVELLAKHGGDFKVRGKLWTGRFPPYIGEYRPIGRHEATVREQFAKHVLPSESRLVFVHIVPYRQRPRYNNDPDLRRAYRISMHRRTRHAVSLLAAQYPDHMFVPVSTLDMDLPDDHNVAMIGTTRVLVNGNLCGEIEGVVKCPGNEDHRYVYNVRLTSWRTWQVRHCKPIGKYRTPEKDATYEKAKKLHGLLFMQKSGLEPANSADADQKIYSLIAELVDDQALAYSEIHFTVDQCRQENWKETYGDILSKIYRDALRAGVFPISCNQKMTCMEARFAVRKSDKEAFDQIVAKHVSADAEAREQD